MVSLPIISFSPSRELIILPTWPSIWFIWCSSCPNWAWLLHSHWLSVGHGTTKGLSKVSINWSKGITVVVLRIKQKIHGILQKCSWLDPRLAWGYIKILGLGVLTFSLGDQPPQSWHVLMDQHLTTGANRSQYCSPPCWKQCDVNATVLRPAFLP